MNQRRAIFEILSRYANRPADAIEPTHHLTFDLQIDSDDATFQLIPELQRAFDIYPTNDEWKGVATVQDLLDLVQVQDRQSHSRESRFLKELHGKILARSQGRRARLLFLALAVWFLLANFFWHSMAFDLLFLWLGIPVVLLLLGHVTDWLHIERAKQEWQKRKFT